MPVKFVVPIVFSLLLCLAGCGPTAKPLSELHPQKATFSLDLTTYTLQNWTGSLVPHEVDMNVPMAKTAIETLEGLGYKYAPDGGTYNIRIRLTCYDTEMVETVHAQDEVVDALDPLDMEDYSDAVNQVATEETWMPLGKQAPDTCTAKGFMQVIVEGGGKGNVYQGAMYRPTSNYVQDCPFNACSAGMAHHLPGLLTKVFKQ